jgi:carbonic anhydrase
MPFALMFGCADARVPTELLFGQEFNDIFNIRVAGNVLFEEGIGSLLYALRTFVTADPPPGHRSLKLAGVLGHRGCGGVRTAIGAYLAPPAQPDPLDAPIEAILRKIADPPLAAAVEALDAVYGPGSAHDPAHLLDLIDLTVYLNAAWVSHQVRQWIARAGQAYLDQVGVVYGVFDPHDLRVRALPPVAGHFDPETFGTPPEDEPALRRLGLDIAHRLASKS